MISGNKYYYIIYDVICDIIYDIINQQTWRIFPLKRWPGRSKG